VNEAFAPEAIAAKIRSALSGSQPGTRRLAHLQHHAFQVVRLGHRHQHGVVA
jgi:hypothetical protein